MYNVYRSVCGYQIVCGFAQSWRLSTASTRWTLSDHGDVLLTSVHSCMS